MNDKSNPDETPFEATLRQLEPCIGDLSAEETFYAAGWNAGHRANTRIRQRLQIRSFAVGIVCSLASVAVVMQIWSTSEIPEQPQMAEASHPPADISTSIAAVESLEPPGAAEVVSDSGASELDQIFAMLSPGGWLAVGREPQRRDPLAVRQPGIGTNGVDVESLWSMTSVRRKQIEPTTEIIPTGEDAEPPRSLRAFPLSPDVFDEWL